MSKGARKKFPIPSALSEGRAFRSTLRTGEGEHICWQFSIMEMEGPFSFAGVKAKDWRALLEKMRQWETMTWGEIEGRRDHAIAVEDLSPDAQNRLLELKWDDLDEVFSLHVSGRKRIIGIRDRYIFRVLWWDPEHRVCPSRKKHT